MPIGVGEPIPEFYRKRNIRVLKMAVCLLLWTFIAAAFLWWMATETWLYQWLWHNDIIF